MAVEFDRYNLFFRPSGGRNGDAFFRLLETKSRYEMRQWAINIYEMRQWTINNVISIPKIVPPPYCRLWSPFVPLVAHIYSIEKKSETCCYLFCPVQSWSLLILFAMFSSSFSEKNKPDRAKMRPDCVPTVSLRVLTLELDMSFMEGQIDGRTDW